MRTTSAEEGPEGWGSTGIPRPLSMTVTELSMWTVTAISEQKPARASSTELSTTS